MSDGAGPEGKMSEPKPLDEADEVDREAAARAADAFARRSSTTARVGALVANAGLACQFQSILTAGGLPFAEIAQLYASVGDRAHGESTILRATGPAQLARAAAAFRKRAALEFAAAAGLPASVRLYLPYYCLLPGVEAIGPALPEVLADARLAPERVIAELLVPPTAELNESNVAFAAQLRAAKILIAIRVADPDESALAAGRAITADFFHIVRAPRSFDEVGTYRAFVRDTTNAHGRAIIGGVETAADASLVDGLGATLFSGDAIAGARFLC